MKPIIFKKTLTILAFSIISFASYSQGRTHDIPANELPENVKNVLTKYINALRSSKTLDDAAVAVLPVVGGGLVNEDGQTLRNSVKPYSLKKDWQNVKFYADPIVITRVNSNPSPTSSGYGPSAIRGRKYKIWIAKKDGGAGLPAPISIIVPEGHETIKSPKVMGIGSL